jgi:hypothetical protein
MDMEAPMSRPSMMHEPSMGPSREVAYRRLRNKDGHIPKRYRLDGRVLYEDEDDIDLAVHHDVVRKGVPLPMVKSGWEKLEGIGDNIYENMFSFSVISVNLLAVWSVVCAGLHEGIFGEAQSVPIKADVIFLFSGLLAFLLVFRNNQAYSRWYEGRTLWGNLTGEIIHMY